MARVLVVEDDDVTRLVLESLLGRAGHRVRTTASVGEAWAVLDRVFTPDVVVTDMFMPGGSGLTLAAGLREDPALRDLPVVFLSGRALPGDVEAARSLSDAYLAKPLSVDDLVATVDGVLATAAAGREERVHDRLADRTGSTRPGGDEADRALFALQLATFAEEGPGRAAALGAAVDAGDTEGLATAVHRLAGTAAGLGAGSLARACLDVEHGAREGRLPDPADLAALTAELAATCRVFTAVAAQVTAGGPARVG